MYEVRLPPEDSVSGGEEESEDGETGIIKGVGTMVKIFHFIMKQSYICALIAMMVSPFIFLNELWVIILALVVASGDCTEMLMFFNKLL